MQFLLNKINKTPPSRTVLRDRGKDHSYGELAQLIEIESGWMKRNTPDSSVVLIQSENSLAFIASVIAALNTGRSALPSLDIKESYLRNEDGQPVILENPAYLRWTSGSVNAPKLAVIESKAIEERILLAEPALDIHSHDHILWMMPMADHFLVSILLYLHCGAAITILNDNNDHDFSSISILYGTPFAYQHLINRLPDHGSLLQPRLALIAGEAVPEYLRRKLIDQTGCSLTSLWGMIEIGIVASCHTSQSGLRHPLRVGPPVPGYDFRLDPVTILGKEYKEILIKGEGFFSGYLTEGNLMKPPLEDGYFRTNDIGQMCDEGEIILQGRKAHAVMIENEAFLAQELEAASLCHPEVMSCRVPLATTITHPILEYITPTESSLLPHQLMEFCEIQLDRSLKSLHFRQVETIPRALSGKVNRLK
ncbi:MAG: AMP-binding protein [Verrucomicrobiota bacterium]